MENNDDDCFSDDFDFDSLPPGTLYELEQNAYQATQPPTTQHYNAQLDPHAHVDFHAQAATSLHQSESLKASGRLHSRLTNEYDTLEVGELEAEVHDNVNGQSALPQDNHVMVAENEWPADDEIGDAMDVDSHAQGNGYELNARLDQLEQEREQMRRELAEARMQVETKAGEIAIIRSKQTRTIHEYDRQLAALRKTMADEATKHKEEVQAAMSEGKMLATENIFLQHDLAEEAHQLRNFKSKQRTEEKQPPVTPRKSRVLPFRDGFDDDEIAVVSPSKSASRSKRNTPTVPGKRKRQASQDSSARLRLSPAGELMMVDSPTDVPGPASEPDHQPPVVSDRDPKFMKQLLNHRMVPGQETDIEALSKAFFPSDPHRPISSFILDELVKQDLGSYTVEYMYTIGPLWQRALTERYYEPVPRFMALARFVLMMDDIALPELIAPLVGVLQSSVEVNAVPRFNYSPTRREKSRKNCNTPQSELEHRVDSTDALCLLYHIACEILHDKKALESFWLHIRHTFILVMLHGSQTLRDIVLILQLLSTSIRPDSFGPIMPSGQDQTDLQEWIINRLTFMLSEPATPDEGIEPYTSHDICAMRLEVLILLESLAFNPLSPSQDHGSAALAAHPNALARLFRSMHDELDALYSSPPEQDLRAALVNGLMRLIFGVMRRHGPSINMQEKLTCVPGCKHKHLVVLTRLAFCDGCVLEAGIEDETVDMAHELLEEWTNPQEAELLAEAFPSSRRD
ncbi:uncharacterized protein N7459_003971 [Penicillium hispanicum]|uniref:uncharacterized protein n=1 Tax=Penicillium hispanicum TaxID=1080232 RepID=UPI00254104CF|nr:uncharacterized protein N7459_003971 [Penicillium hispanicum]KAJ5584171.1 hypothetical protein N7459_003971 [Penicillium hispanicum]